VAFSGWGLPFPSGNSLAFTSFDVPAGQELVIEEVSVFGALFDSPGQKIQIEIQSLVQNTPILYDLVGTRVALGYLAASSVNLYADPGTQVRVTVIRADTTGSSDLAYVTLIGYLVNTTNVP